MSVLIHDLLQCHLSTDPATTQISTLSLHDALPISGPGLGGHPAAGVRWRRRHHLVEHGHDDHDPAADLNHHARSEEHTSELQSRQYLVCRLLLEKKKTISLI